MSTPANPKTRCIEQTVAILSILVVTHFAISLLMWAVFGWVELRNAVNWNGANRSEYVVSRILWLTGSWPCWLGVTAGVYAYFRRSVNPVGSRCVLHTTFGILLLVAIFDIWNGNHQIAYRSLDKRSGEIWFTWWWMSFFTQR